MTLTVSSIWLRASGEAATVGGLRSNSLAAASALPLAACEGPSTGALTLADEQHALPPTVAAPQARLPLEQERERHVAWRMPHPLSSPRRPPGPWRRARDELKPAAHPYLARQMSWCGKPQPGGGMHPHKPRG